MKTNGYQPKKSKGKQFKSLPPNVGSSVQEANKINKVEDALLVLRSIPIPGLLASINTQIRILNERGVEICDWDNKEKKLEQIQMIGGKVYFLAQQTEEKTDGRIGDNGEQR